MTLVEGGVTRDLWVSTFHATCARILRRDIEKVEPERRAIEKTRLHPQFYDLRYR